MANTPPVDYNSLNDNTKAFYDQWKEILHSNRACKLCDGQCRCADYLVNNRLECIKRGMPDLHPKLEQRVWNEAFRLHENRCPLPQGSINPTWSEIQLNMCDCFEKALQSMKESGTLEPQTKLPPMLVDPLDDLFTERFI